MLFGILDTKTPSYVPNGSQYDFLTVKSSKYISIPQTRFVRILLVALAFQTRRSRSLEALSLAVSSYVGAVGSCIEHDMLVRAVSSYEKVLGATRSL